MTFVKFHQTMQPLSKFPFDLQPRNFICFISPLVVCPAQQLSNKTTALAVTQVELTATRALVGSQQRMILDQHARLQLQEQIIVSLKVRGGQIFCCLIYLPFAVVLAWLSSERHL